MSLGHTRRCFLSLAVGAVSARPFEQISGSWSASIDGQRVGGAWTALPHELQDAAWGSWSLLDRSGKQLASGAWSVRKSGGRWEGRWQAAKEGRGPYSGSWTAQLEADGASPMYKMFELALEGAVSGTWNVTDRKSETWAIQADQRD